MARGRKNHPSRRNPVARFGSKINRPATHKDRKHAYKRGERRFRQDIIAGD